MSFLSNVANGLLANGWQGLGQYTLVFPMHRAGLYMRQELLRLYHEQNCDAAVEMPRMETIQSLVDALCPLRPAEEIRSVCLLYSLFKEYSFSTLKGGMLPLDVFYGWGQQLLADFNMIDMSLLTTRKVLANVAEAQLLEQYPIDEQLEDYLRTHLYAKDDEKAKQHFFEQLWQILPALYEAFTAKQEEDGYATRGRQLRWVLEHKEEVLEEMKGRFAFVGFNYLLPAERELMKMLADNGQAVFYWDYDPDFQLDKGVYGFIRENIEKTGFVNSLPAEAPQQEKKHVRAVATASSHAQALYVHDWLTSLYPKPEEGQPLPQKGSTAIVIADESMLESVAYALPDYLSGHVNITKGYPLKNTKVYASVRAFLADTANAPTEKESLVDLIRRVEAHLAKSRPPHVEAYSRKEESPDRHNDFLKLRWREVLAEEAYCQTMLLLHRLQVLIEKDELFLLIRDMRTMSRLILRAMERVSIPFHGEPLTEIQVIGVLETRLLDFDNLLILGVEEGVIPKTGTDNSFIPYDIRKANHMATRDEDTKVYAYNFFRLLRRSQNTTLLFSEASDGMGKRSMSRFLLQMLVRPDLYDVKKLQLLETVGASEVEEPTIKVNWLKEETLRLSPSSISTYIACPRKFYYEKVMHEAAPETESTILEVSSLGTLIHGVLEAAYKKMTEGRTLPTVVAVSDIEDYLNGYEYYFPKALEESYKALNDDHSRHHPHSSSLFVPEDHPAENLVVKEVAKRVLENDRDSGAICLHGLERKVVHELTIKATDKRKVKVLLNGSIDRFDEIGPAGARSLRILDYKTGGYDAGKLAAKSVEDVFADYKRHYVLQTMLYCYIVEKEKKNLKLPDLPIMPELLFTLHLSEDPHIFIGERKDKQAVRDFRTYIADFEKQLLELIKRIVDDQSFDKCEEGKCDSYCPFFAVCAREKPKY